MKKDVFAAQLVAIIVFSSALGGMVFYSGIYDEVYLGIVSVTCLSCIKLQPATSADFTFETVDNKPHPDFVLENLSIGPVFLAYRTTVCDFCDDMDPVLEDVFGIENISSHDMLYRVVDFNGTNVVFIHINKTTSPKVFGNSMDVYDKDDIGAVPMFTLVTIRYHGGPVHPYYTSLYGVINKDFTDEQRVQTFTNLIYDGIELYNENKEGFNVFS